MAKILLEFVIFLASKILTSLEAEISPEFKISAFF